MADGTAIEWTHRPGTKPASWNPIAGCDIVSPGCTHCYAMRQAHRNALMAKGLGRDSHYEGTTKLVKGKAVWTGRITIAPDSIFLAPLRWKSPRTVFVNSMSDLFHEAVPKEIIDRVFAIMALCPQHTFLVLTKRADRMRAYLTAARAHPVALEALELTLSALVANPRSTVGSGCIIQGDVAHLQTWPLPNVWLGVSAEDQKRADERIPNLLATPAAIRFVSAEPLLGPIDFTMIPTGGRIGDAVLCADALAGPSDLGAGERLDWIIVGGESGRGARPMHPDWARSIRDQFAAAGTAFFFKQWGEHLGGKAEDSGDAVWFEAASGKHDSRWLTTSDEFDWFDAAQAPDGPIHLKLGKGRAGRLLDGREHSEFPEPAERPEARP